MNDKAAISLAEDEKDHFSLSPTDQLLSNDELIRKSRLLFKRSLAIHNKNSKFANRLYTQARIIDYFVKNHDSYAFSTKQAAELRVHKPTIKQ